MMTREQRLAAREADTVPTATLAKVVEVVLVEGQRAQLFLPDGNVAVLQVQHAKGGYCRLSFTKGDVQAYERSSPSAVASGLPIAGRDKTVRTR